MSNLLVAQTGQDKRIMNRILLLVFMETHSACDHRSADQLTAFDSKWEKQTNRTIMRNNPLSCDLRSADQLTTFAYKWEKQTNRNIVRNNHLACDLLSAGQLTVFASNWEKQTNRTMMRNNHLACDLRWAGQLTIFASKWENRRTELSWERIIWHVIFDQPANWQPLLPSEKTDEQNYREK
jgi:hypothetical protein